MSLMHKVLVSLVLVVGILTGTAAEPNPSVPLERTDDMGKEQREEINDDLKKMNGKIDLAFIGDSITRRWRGDESKPIWDKYWGSYRSVNMGIGGDTTQNVLWRLQYGQLDGYQARVFVVMIGTNNCWGEHTVPADVAAGVKKILELIKSKQPRAQILLLSILPVGEKPNPGRTTRMTINKLISKFHGGNVHYMDIAAKFLQSDGSISNEVMPDELHLGPKGYEIWASAINEKVKELMGEVRPKKKP